MNTPLSTIYNDHNGNITDANIAANAAIAGSKIAPATLPLAALVTTYTNPGSAGGTSSFFYINLGGIKLFWGTTATQTSSAAANSYAITLPTSFFSTIQSVTANAVNMTADTRQYISVSGQNTTTVTLTFVSPGGAATTGAFVFVIGT